jgi:hypothetical protein
VAIHREVTFERGTVGRFLQFHGISMKPVRIPRSLAPELVEKLAEEGENLYILRFVGPRGSMETWLNWPKGSVPTAEQAIVALGLGALEYEQSGGDLFGWATQAGLDPTSPETRRIFRDLRRDTELLANFLGPEGFVELLDLVSGFASRPKGP